MNILNFTGGLSRDAETRFTPGGDAITSFGVALSSGYGDKKITTWLNATIFGKRGQSLAPYLKKGAQVAISGEFTARPYTTKDGAEKLSLDVRVNDLTLIGGVSGNGKSDNGGNGKAQRQDKKANEKEFDQDEFDREVPF